MTRSAPGRREKGSEGIERLRVALVHDWLTGMRGGERVLEGLCEILPRSEIFTLFHFPGSVSPEIEARPIHTSWARRLPGLRRWYRHYLPLYPRAIRSLDLRGFDLVVSTSHCVAKGVPVPPGVKHVAYLHTPMRYVWGQYEAYFSAGRSSRFVRAGMRLFAPSLRRWDLASNDRVDRFLANSREVARRIETLYRRKAEVVYPPVDCDFFTPEGEAGEGYLMVTALSPYKRIDLAMEVCRKLGRRLVVVGSGPDEARLKRLAGEGVELKGWQSREEVLRAYRACRAFLLPGEEDFGIAPVEAMACGRPVVALGRGGALETVVPLGKQGSGPPTGVLVFDPAPRSFAEGILALERNYERFRPEAIRRRALAFDRSVFRSAVRRVLEETVC